MQRRGIAVIIGLLILPIWIALFIISIPVSLLHWVLESLIDWLKNITDSLKRWVEEGEG